MWLKSDLNDLGGPRSGRISGQGRATVDSPQRPSRYAWFVKRVKRHAYWARTQGVAALVEEDELNLRDRWRRRRSTRQWAKLHGVAGDARAIYVVGAQRSGTNFLVRHLQQYPAVEVHNENSRAAFDRFLFKSDRTIAELIASSQQKAIVFKPLCDSHRTNELLDNIETPVESRAIWVYRAWQARARSAVAKFGSSNLDVLSAAAEETWGTSWQLSGVSEENREFVESLNFEGMSPESGSALFWFIRNSLFFDGGLDQRDDVLLVSYDRLTADPEHEFAIIERFVGLEGEQPMSTEQIRPASVPELPDIDPAVRQRCEELQRRLDAAWDAQEKRIERSTDHTEDVP
ncbi:MAG: hypothetical protein DWP92_08250 [Armatimonadetes bacterium]|nr:MAG: hypothetical protein DWP92_08250 [Armatimonadota bacterium]